LPGDSVPGRVLHLQNNSLHRAEYQVLIVTYSAVSQTWHLFDLTWGEDLFTLNLGQPNLILASRHIEDHAKAAISELIMAV
jgi:hypothetical protein